MLARAWGLTLILLAIIVGLVTIYVAFERRLISEQGAFWLVFWTIAALLIYIAVVLYFVFDKFDEVHE